MSDKSREINSSLAKPYYPSGWHPNSKKNLRLFKKGEVHNPRGRPKGVVMSEAYRHALMSPAPKEMFDQILTSGTPTEKAMAKKFRRTGATFGEWIAVSMVIEASVGEHKVQAAAELVDRLEGRPAQMLRGDPEAPLLQKTYIGFSPDDWDAEKHEPK